MEKIYILSTCNEHKMRDSMRMVFIGTDIEKLYSTLNQEIEIGNMEYERENLEQDLKDLTITEINDNLTYGYIECFDYKDTKDTLTIKSWLDKFKCYLNDLVNFYA